MSEQFDSELYYDRHGNSLAIGNRVKVGNDIGKISSIKVVGFGVNLISKYRVVTLPLEDVQKIINPPKDILVGMELDRAQAKSLVSDVGGDEQFILDSIPIHYQMKVSTSVLSSVKVSSYREDGTFEIDKSLPEFKKFSVGDQIRWGVWGDQHVGTIKEIFADGSALVKLSFFKSTIINLVFDYAIVLAKSAERINF